MAHNSSPLRLLIPGPVACYEEVLAAMAEPTLPHYGPSWLPILEELYSMTQRLLETKGTIIMLPGSGTLGLDAVTSNLVESGAGYVILNNGWFAERWGKIATAHGIHAYMIDFPLGQHMDPEVIVDRLKELIPQAKQEGHPIKALATVHHDTSVGVLNPLEEIGQICREFELPFVVDAVASFGGMHIAVDELGIDVLVGTPNKCLGAPPGISIISLSERAISLIRQNISLRGWYLDIRNWLDFRTSWPAHPYPSTQPTNNMVAVHRAYQRLFTIGPDEHYGQVKNAAQQVRQGMHHLGFQMFPQAGYEAPMISVFKQHPELDLTELATYLMQEHKVMIGGGIDNLVGKIIRVGHMGASNQPANVDAFLSGVRQFAGQKGVRPA